MERDLPVLLERIVPHLTMPADRMAQVRRRVQQRRRRMRVAVTAAALAVGCVVVATGLWPGTLGPGQGRRAPAAASTVSQKFSPVRLQGPLEGVTMYLPTTWHSLSVSDDYGTTAGFVSSQALRTPGTGTCPRITDAVLTVCPPLTDLNKDGVLIAFLPSETNRSSSAAPLVRGSLVPADKSCRAIGGDTQMTGWAHSHSPSSVKGSAVKIDVCLREPSQQTLSQVSKILLLAFL